MAEQGQKPCTEKPKQVPPEATTHSVIVHSGMENARVSKILKHRGMRLKATDKCLPNTFIFPKAKVAFFLVNFDKELVSCVAGSTPSGVRVTTSTTTGNGAAAEEPVDICDEDDRASKLFSSITKFCQLHGHCYVILEAPLFTILEFEALQKLQSRFLGKDNVDFLLAHNAEDCVKAMRTIAMVQSPPMANVLHQRFCRQLSRLVQQLPVQPLPK